MMRLAPPTFHPVRLSRPTLATLALGLALWVAPARGELVFSDGFEFLPSSLQALVVWEEQAEQPAPDGYSVVEARRYGDSWVTVLRAG